MRIEAERFHDFSCGHRVHGHEGKCALMHGHNYRAHFTVVQVDSLGAGTTLDDVGRVLDFSVINAMLCDWLEKNWDHRFLAWGQDPYIKALEEILGGVARHHGSDAATMFLSSIVLVPFNPTAENMAIYLVQHVGPIQLKGRGCTLTKCRIEETRKCSATFCL